MEYKMIRIDLGGVNSYLVKVNGNFILFDTGGHTVLDKTFTNRRESLEKELENQGCKAGNLKLVLLTHGDNDHVANSVYIKEKYKTKIAIHLDDTPLVENPSLDMVMGSFHYRAIVFKVIFQIMKKQIMKVTKKILDDFETFKPDFYVDEGYSLSEYGFDAKVLHIPGHTAGSIGVLTDKGDFIAGDTFTNMNKPDIAPNAYDFKKLAVSIDRLKAMNIKTIYPGHGEPFEMKQLK